jgi:hypothetical protein
MNELDQKRIINVKRIVKRIESELRCYLTKHAFPSLVVSEHSLTNDDKSTDLFYVDVSLKDRELNRIIWFKFHFMRLEPKHPTIMLYQIDNENDEWLGNFSIRLLSPALMYRTAATIVTQSALIDHLFHYLSNAVSKQNVGTLCTLPPSFSYASTIMSNGYVAIEQNRQNRFVRYVTRADKNGDTHFMKIDQNTVSTPISTLRQTLREWIE